MVLALWNAFPGEVQQALRAKPGFSTKPLIDLYKDRNPVHKQGIFTACDPHQHATARGRASAGHVGSPKFIPQQLLAGLGQFPA